MIYYSLKAKYQVHIIIPEMGPHRNATLNKSVKADIICEECATTICTRVT